MEKIFAAGGIVMWPLLGFSILAIALIIERLVFWIRVNRRQRRLVRDALSIYQTQPEDTIARLKKDANIPIARIFLEALEMGEISPNAFKLALESATQAELPLLRRFNTIFDIIIAASPLLGLLGTILGLIRSFDAIDVGSIGAGGNANVVTGGISEALVSTAAGLAVAIVTLVFANIFRGLYRRQITLIQEYGGQLELLHLCRYEDLGLEDDLENENDDGHFSGAEELNLEAPLAT